MGRRHRGGTGGDCRLRCSVWEGVDLGMAAVLLAACVAVWALIFFFPPANPTNPPAAPLQLPAPESMPAGITVRNFQESDRAACIAIFESNAGEFVPPDLGLFLKAIDTDPCGFFVAEKKDGRVVACGGITRQPQEPVAYLWMGLVHRDQHRCGLGTLMLLTRLAHLRDQLTAVGLETTALAEPLYQRFGFRRCSEPEQRYIGGFSHFTMYRHITRAECEQIRLLLRKSPVQFGFDLASPPSRPSAV